MKPQFDTGFEYDEWYDKKKKQKILDDYFGEEVSREEKDGENTKRS